MDFPQLRQPFYNEIQKTPIDLGKAALCIGLEAYPNLDIDRPLCRSGKRILERLES